MVLPSNEIEDKEEWEVNLDENTVTYFTALLDVTYKQAEISNKKTETQIKGKI